MKYSKLFKLIFLVLVVFSFFVSLYVFKAPKPKMVTLQKDAFSISNALHHVEKIAQKPHSMATDEHTRIKDYIVDELIKMGIDTALQSTTSMYDFRGGVSAGYVYNVMGILHGKGYGKSVLITAHYDSQPHTLGASDDGAAVAAMLEAARALKKSKPLKNDIIFLFSDGEEAGLFGAKAFVEQHPMAKNVGLVLNLEARGSSGPSYMFEVSSENGWIMKEFKKAVRYPVASSLAYEVYKLMDNNSDFTIYKNNGYSGFNAAFIEGYADYHNMTDDKDQLSQRSLYHHASYIMDICKHFGNLDLTNTKAEDLVYFNLIGYQFITYPQSINVYMIGLISLLVITLIFVHIKKKKLHFGKLLLGFILILVTFALSLGAVWLAQKGIRATYPWYENFYDANFYNVHWYFLFFGALCLLIVSFIWSLVYKKIDFQNLSIAIVLLYFILLIGVQIYIPTGLFLFSIPILALIFILFLRLSVKGEVHKKRYLFSVLIFSFPVICLLFPYVKVLYITFGLEMAVGGSALWILLLYFLLPVYEVSVSIKRWFFPVVALWFGLLFLLIAHFKSDYNEIRPLQSNVNYCQNANTGESFWISNKTYIDDWNKQFFKNASMETIDEIYPSTKVKMLKSKAPRLNIQEPQLSILKDSIIDRKRHLSLNIRSLRGAENTQIFIQKSAAIENILINGKKLTDKKFFAKNNSIFYRFNYYGLYEAGIDIEMVCSPESVFSLVMIEKKFGLPEIEGVLPMPKSIVPDSDYFSNLTLLSKTWNFKGITRRVKPL